MKKLAKSAQFNEKTNNFEVEYWDGTYAEIPYTEAIKNPIVVKNDKTGEEWLKYRMAEGWNIDIECKGKGRTYEMSYEATAVQVGIKDIATQFANAKHAVGDTLWELMHNLFESYDLKKNESEQKGEKDETIL